MNVVLNTDHSCGSSLSLAEMEVLIDTIAAECLQQSERLDQQQAQIDAQRVQIEKWRSLTNMVRRQVEAGKMAVESAVSILSGAHPV